MCKFYKLKLILNFKTPLHHASANGHLEIVKYLIEKGAYVDATTVSILIL